MWRCPHCGTPQAETARCWVCRESSTSCATCRHFRRAVAVNLGYCGLDRSRSPLHGDEIRPCWEAPLASGERERLPVIAVSEASSVAGAPGAPGMLPRPLPNALAQSPFVLFGETEA
jgi:hypothetical protein